MNYTLDDLKCSDGSCCCIPTRAAIILLSLLSIGISLVDIATHSSSTYNQLMEKVGSFRTLVATLFQMSSVLLLIAAIIENARMVQMYIWHTFGFVIMGLVASMGDFVLRLNTDGAMGLVTFVPEVVFIFVLCRCLPFVDVYRRNLEEKLKLD